MARSKQSSLKREKEKKKLRKREEKQERRAERQSHSKKGMGLDLISAEIISSVASPVLESINTNTPPFTPSNEIISGEGRVAYYNEQKGYGFIKDNRTKGTVFFHTASLPAPVKVNDILMYDVVKGPKGATADKIIKPS